MATDLREFDSWHPWPIDADRALDLALACEQAGRDSDSRIENSDGASLGTGESISVYANSHGFVGRERSTQHSLGCALIVGRGDAMQRDGWYSIGLSADDLESAATIGRKAAQRAVSRLEPRQIATGEYPVLFAAEMARSLIGHLLGAVSGGALYRRASFLVDSAGQKLFPDWFGIDELPFLSRGYRSAVVRCRRRGDARIGAGEATACCSVTCWAVTRRASSGLVTTANAGGVHNLQVEANAGDFESMLRGMGRGLLVTELMGQGVNNVTGDYSRGAAGFWVENGQIAYPVDGITIAGNLKSMFAAIEAVGSDVDPRSHVRTGSILVGRMTVAGEVEAEA